MISKRWPLASIFLILANLLAFAMAEIRCLDNGNYTNNSTYRSNLDTLLSSLSTKVDYNGFYNASMGPNLDTVYACVLCRGDLQLPTCRTCIQNATTDIVKTCPNYKQAVQFGEFCMIRYSDKPTFRVIEIIGRCWRDLSDASSPDKFLLDVRTLVENLRDQAANGGSLRKVAAGNRSTVDFQTVFSLVQCTPDLSSKDCSICLIKAIEDIPYCCRTGRGCTIILPSCSLRYEVSPFYNETRLQEIQALTTPPLPPSPGPPPGEKDHSNSRIIVIVVVSVGACLIAAVCVGILLIKRTKKKLKEKLESVDDINLAESLQYDFCGIKAATNYFSNANKLGHGGFGAVYKGKLPNGQEIAVKRLSIGSSQGEAEFKNEVSLVAKLQHRNLVRLLGFSMEGKERLLVYEFVENASLDKFIFDPTKRNDLDGERRYKIIGGISRGLLYLHEESRLKIIHRDLKASNILLDGEMNSKIADFGIARLCSADETQGSTSRIVGTYGYMSPEYAMHGKFSVKSDVFSFGVLILEIVTGQRNNPIQNGENMEDLLSVAWKRWRQGTIEDMIDPAVSRTNLGSLHHMLRCIHIGLLCVQDNPMDRPTMASVVLMLSSFTISLPVPLKPTFFTTSGYNSKAVLFQASDSNEFVELTKSSYENKSPRATESSKNDMSISEFYPEMIFGL